jgi:hypothetical protein
MASQLFACSADINGFLSIVCKEAQLYLYFKLAASFDNRKKKAV